MNDLSNKLEILEYLAKDGILEIRAVGTTIRTLILELEELDLTVSARSTIQGFRRNLSAGWKQIRRYANNHRQMVDENTPIDTQINSLETPFGELREIMGDFYDTVEKFINDQGYVIQNGHVMVPRISKASEANQAGETSKASEASQAGETSKASEATEENEESQMAEVAKVKEASKLSRQKKEVESGEKPDTDLLANNKLICELTIPFKTVLPVSSYEVSVFSNGFLSINPQFQLQYFTTTDNCNTLFFGVKCDIRMNLSNLSKLHHENSHVVSARIFNTTGKIYRTPERSETTLSVGHIWEVQNTEMGTFVNVEVGQMRNTSFQLDWSPTAAMVSLNKISYLTCKPSISYEVFPFTQKLNESVENSDNGTIIPTGQNTFLDSISQENVVSQNDQLTSTTLNQSLNNLMDVSGLSHISESTIKNKNVQFDSTPSIQCITHDCIEVNQSPKIRGEVAIDPTLPSMSQTHTNIFYRIGFSGIIALILGIFIYRSKNTIKEFFYSLTKTKKDV